MPFLAPAAAAVLLALLPAPATAAALGIQTVWSCATLASAQLSAAASWQTLNCSGTGIPIFGPAGPLIINVVTADLASPTLRLVPVMAPLSGVNRLAPLNKMAEDDGRALIAGINGGYFFRTDLGKSWFDDVCVGKTYDDALANASLSVPNDGPGDGAIVAAGALLSSNCNCPGFSRPVVMTINGANSRFDVLTRGAPPPAGLTLDAISSGPNFVSSNSSGSYIDIPSDDDNIGNILEHAANTGVGLLASPGGGALAFLVTTDGFDGCSPFNASCGTNAFTLAYFFKDYLNATSAMGMDQGGSTTMWVKGQGADGIVSHAGGGTRNINSGLFLLQD